MGSQPQRFRSKGRGQTRGFQRVTRVLVRYPELAHKMTDSLHDLGIEIWSECQLAVTNLHHTAVEPESQVPHIHSIGER
jgi:hypothetical protein